MKFKTTLVIEWELLPNESKKSAVDAVSSSLISCTLDALSAGRKKEIISAKTVYTNVIDHELDN